MAAIIGYIWNFLVKTYSLIAIVPIIPFVVAYFLNTSAGKNRKEAIRSAMDVTTFFLVGIVAALLNRQLGMTFGLYLLLLLMLIAGGLIGNAQNRANGKVDAAKVVRVVWRLSFFFLALLYVLLMLIELIKLIF